jgi:ribosome maturation factor RimP
VEDWKQFLNKKIKIIYDDRGNFPSKKEGIFVGVNDTHLIIKVEGKGTQALLISNVIRLEELNG